MNYQKYAKECLSDPQLLKLLPDGKIFRIRAIQGHSVPYVTYIFYDKSGSYFAEGKVKKNRYYIQIDINSNSDFTEIEEAVRSIADANGWNEGTEYEDLDPDTNLMFKCMRFSFELNK